MKGQSDCAVYQERLVEAAYGELADVATELLAAHLAGCESCRAESDSLHATRRLLRGALAAPSLDPSSTVVVMPRMAPRSPRWLRLAAAAAILALVAVAFGRAEIVVGEGGTTVSFRVRGGGAEATSAAETTSAVVLAALRELRARDAQAREALPKALAQEFDRRDITLRESQDLALARLVDEIDRRRAQDLGFVLNQMGSLEQRTGVEMARTQQLLQYAVMAQPGGVDTVR